MTKVTEERAILDQLVAMSQWLGEPERDYVILGEGNTSARVGDDRMYIKASGTRLEAITADGFTCVQRSKALAILGAGDLSDDEIARGLREALVDPAGRQPSVETLFHSYLLGLEGVNFVGHTHPTAVNAILCSRDGKQAIMGRICPDEIVVCGVTPLFVDYTDPGVPLGRAIRCETERYMEQHGERPQALLLQNHGLIALGATPAQVQAITATWVKTARILTAAMAFGGPRHLSPDNVHRIHTRPDEKLRRDGLMGSK